MKKKLLALILAGVMVLSLAACGGKEEPAPAEDSTKTEEPDTQEPAAETYTVGAMRFEFSLQGITETEEHK